MMHRLTIFPHPTLRVRQVAQAVATAWQEKYDMAAFVEAMAIRMEMEKKNDN